MSVNTPVVVEHNDKLYIIVILKNNLVPFIVDYEDYNKIKKIKWFFCINTYIASSKMENSVKIHTYLHRFIMNAVFENNNYVDHINRIHQDNRKENLRIATQTEQNYNQKKKTRNVKLPKGCGINPDDIPTYIGYHYEKCKKCEECKKCKECTKSKMCKKCKKCKKCKYRDFFDVDIKIDGIQVYRKASTKSEKISLIDKLNLASDLLKTKIKEHPEWFENRCLNGHLSKEGDELYESYFAILKKAGIDDPFNEYVSKKERNKEYI